MKDLDKDVEQRFDELEKMMSPAPEWQLSGFEVATAKSKLLKLKQLVTQELAAAKEEGAREERDEILEEMSILEKTLYVDYQDRWKMLKGRIEVGGDVGYASVVIEDKEKFFNSVVSELDTNVICRIKDDFLRVDLRNKMVSIVEKLLLKSKTISKCKHEWVKNEDVRVFDYSNEKSMGSNPRTVCKYCKEEYDFRPTH